MSVTHSQDVLRLLSETATERENDLAQYLAMRSDGSDDEAEAEFPNFNSFYNVGGNQSILNLTNFTASEFSKLYGILHTCITTKRNNGRN